jgi:hypothetical protein
VTKYIKVVFAYEFQDPMKPGDPFAKRKEFSAPHYDVLRDGDTVSVSCSLGTIDAPWGQVVYAVRPSVAAPAPNADEDTSPGVKRKGKSK